MSRFRRNKLTAFGIAMFCMGFGQLKYNIPEIGWQ